MAQYQWLPVQQYLNQVSCASMLTFMGTFMTSNLIGDAPLDIICSGSCGSTDIKAKICVYFVQNYLRYVDINDKGDITAKARYSVHVDSMGINRTFLRGTDFNC